MKTRISISHLIRHFLLFALTVLFLLTLIRAGFSLWQFNHIADVQTLLRSFLQGIRFDIATVGMLLLVPVVLVPLFAMFNFSRGLARLFSPLWLALALLLVLVMELVTPYFIQSSNIRPDFLAIQSLQGVNAVFTEVLQNYLIPAAVGTLLLLMLMYAFWARMELSRFLRYPIKKIPAMLLSIVGLVVCVLAIRSNIDPATPAMGPDAALISTDAVMNEIALNSTYKTLHSAYTASDKLQSLIKVPDLSALSDLMPE